MCFHLKRSMHVSLLSILSPHIFTFYVKVFMPFIRGICDGELSVVLLTCGFFFFLINSNLVSEDFRYILH